MLLLSRSQVEERLDVDELLDALRDGFQALADGEVNAPPRNEVHLSDDAILLSMPGRLRAGQRYARGLRIDHVLATVPLAERCSAAGIDRNERNRARLAS